MAGTNNFLVFNEANNPTFTMSDADYYADLYRLNGLIPMIADPLAHNKMFRQWSIMIKALADIMASMNYNASDSDLATLETNLKSTIEDVAEAKVDSRITTLEDWKDSITATPAEINTLDGVTVTPTEINYLSGASSNIQTQINNLSISALFPLWQASTSYSVGDVVKTLSSSFWVYLECVVAGTSDTTEPTFTNVGELVTDGTAKWLVLDLRDSQPVGSFRSDMIQRAGWLKANGATVNRADYPRLWAYAVDNLLTTNDTTNYPGLFGTGDGSTTFTLPNFEDYFVRYSFTRVSGHKQDSQMASHTHTCQDHTGSHDHTAGNQSASHQHKYIYDSMVGSTGTNGSIVSGAGYGRTIGKETTTYNQDTNHTHTINSKSITHRHTINSTGSGSNTYPDNIAMQMYIKY